MTAIDITQAPPSTQRIERLACWVVTHEDGGEGIPAISDGPLMIPLIGADTARIAQLWPAARDMADLKGLPVRLVHFAKIEPEVDEALRDEIAQAIRGEPRYGELPWETISEDRKRGWRADADRVLVVLARRAGVGE